MPFLFLNKNFLDSISLANPPRFVFFYPTVIISITSRDLGPNVSIFALIQCFRWIFKILPMKPNEIKASFSS
jgi:hypothetical protein